MKFSLFPLKLLRIRGIHSKRFQMRELIMKQILKKVRIQVKKLSWQGVLALQGGERVMRIASLNHLQTRKINRKIINKLEKLRKVTLIMSMAWVNNK